MKQSIKGMHSRVDEMIERVYSLEGHGHRPPSKSRSPLKHVFESDSSKFRELEDKIKDLEYKM